MGGFKENVDVVVFMSNILKDSKKDVFRLGGLKTWVWKGTSAELADEDKVQADGEKALAEAEAAQKALAEAAHGSASAGSDSSEKSYERFRRRRLASQQGKALAQKLLTTRPR